MMPHVYLNGRVIPSENAFVPVDDRGILYGDGIFETMRSYQGRVFLLDRHIRRLFDAAKRLEIKIPESAEELAEAVAETVRANGGGDLYVRLTVTRGRHAGSHNFKSVAVATRIVICRPLTPPAESLYESGAQALVVPVPGNAASALRGIKSLSFLEFLVYKNRALREEVFEAILVDAEGFVVEGATSNIFSWKNGMLKTPPLRRGPLDGITRGLIFELAGDMGIECLERDLRLDDLRRGQEVFITNSVVEILGLSRIIGDEPMSFSKPTMANRLRDAYRKACVDHK